MSMNYCSPCRQFLRRPPMAAWVRMNLALDISSLQLGNTARVANDRTASCHASALQNLGSKVHLQSHLDSRIRFANCNMALDGERAGQRTGESLGRLSESVFFDLAHRQGVLGMGISSQYQKCKRRESHEPTR